MSISQYRKEVKQTGRDFYWHLAHSKAYVCENCGINFLSEEDKQSPILCHRCKEKERISADLAVNGIVIYNGKVVRKTLSATQAAIAFGFSDYMFRKLKRAKIIPGEQRGDTFWVDTQALDSLMRNGELTVNGEYKPITYTDLMREYQAKWYQRHKPGLTEKQRKRRCDKAWKAAHKEQINQHIRERKQADPIYKLKCQARTTIYKSFARTGNVKSERCEKLVGLSMDDFVAYLKQTYEQTYGRPWDGVADVHIDHIVPLATAQTEEDVKRLCNYTNLRLITAEDNQRKGAKLDYAI